MYFQIYIIVNMLSYTNYVNSFRENVHDIYWDTLSTINNNVVSQIYPKHYKIIEMSKPDWAAVCKNIIRDLRSNEEYIDVYVNYTAFSVYSGEQCTKILVWVPRISKNIEQNACICFIHSSVISLDTPHEYIDYYRKIMIYPLSLQKVMIFVYNEERESYNILEIFKTKFWTQYSPMKKKAVITIIPQSYSEISNLQIILHPIFPKLKYYSEKHWNIVNVSGVHYFSKICQIVLRRMRYIEEIIVSPMEVIPKNGEQLIATLITRNNDAKQTFMLAYTCTGYIPKTTTIITKYKIAAGPNDTSIIVLRETNCPINTQIFQNEPFSQSEKCYEIIEFIEYVSYEYVDFLFRHH